MKFAALCFEIFRPQLKQPKHSGTRIFVQISVTLQKSVHIPSAYG
ncbi:hypothetical protein BVI434_1250007 [Burkholderia vietnamiensis]|nr:hypothetical protein BVI434_1250007 [Burkholderia vietnamiensis]